MARPLRIQYPGAWYHITSRGNERKDIYKSRRDREKFLEYLVTATERYGARIHGYCLMDNHYHLLIETPEGNLSQIMQHINGSYTTYYNIKRKRAGHLFQGRYGAILVDANSYALELSRYIHLNPVRAGMVESIELHPWSSYVHYVTNNCPEWLQVADILAMLSDDEANARKKYRQFVLDRHEHKEILLKNVTANCVLGSEQFVDDIRSKHIRGRKTDRNLPSYKALTSRRSMGRIVDVVGKNITAQPLRRKISIYLSHRYSGERLREIGGHFHLSESGVTQASRRLAAELKENRELSRRVNRIIEELGLCNV